MKYCKNCGTKIDKYAKFCPKCGTPVVLLNNSEPLSENTEGDQPQGKTVKHSANIYGKINLEDLPVGYLIDNRYEIKEKIGQGGFGAVYQVYDKDMNIDKALKVIPEAIINDKEAMQDLQKEAQTMIALNHSNIVRVYDFHKTGKIKYIDMEFIDGKTLTDIKLEHPNKQVPESEVKGFALKIAEGLAYAHANNVIHKDIKPQNVMVNKKGEIKIMDFGIAETVRTSMSRLQNSSSSGTLVYMSPEQFMGQNVGRESDIYSFGVLLYELLTGKTPFFRGDIQYQILNKKPEPLDFVSDEINKMLMKCLEKDYKDRFKNAEELIEILGGEIRKYKRTINSQIFKRSESKNRISKLTLITINSNPKGAAVFLNGKKLEQQTPINIKYKTGIADIRIVKESYAEINERIEIKEESSNEFFLELESVMGEILVAADKPGQAIIFNGKQTDYHTPHTFKNIIPDRKYTFQINTKSYLSKEVEIKIKNNESKKIALPSILGFIKIDSDKPGQTIICNGKQTDYHTPHTFKNIIPDRKYTFQINTESYLSKKIEVKINNNESKEIKLFSKLGSIKIDANKQGLSIIFNGEKTKHKTPHTFEYLLFGKYKIEIEDDKYYSEPKEIILNEKEDKTVTLEIKKYATLVVDTQYKDLTFMIKGKNGLNANREYKLEEGKYTLQPSLNFLPEINIDLKPGEVKVIDYDLKVEKKTLSINKGKYKISGEIIRKDRDELEKIREDDNGVYELYPGDITVKLKSKFFQKNYSIDLCENKTIDDFEIRIINKIKEKGRKKIFAGSILASIIILLILLKIFSIARENSLWEKVQTKNTEASYLTYLYKYPNGKYRNEAINKYPLLDNMVFVKGGTFQMGSNDGESDEKPIHSVTVGDFYMGKYEVTNREYIEFLNTKGVNSNGSYSGKEYIDIDDGDCAIGYRNGNFYFKGSQYASSKDCPVIEVTWYGADAYCKWKGGRLPTEAEWEYAARGGTEGANGNSHKYSGSNNIGDVAWYYKNSGNKTHSVGQKQANELGIYDMSGNVWEWCNDWYNNDYYSSSPRNDPQGPSSGSHSVLRGGSRYSYTFCRVANRGRYGRAVSSDYVGFRVVHSMKERKIKI